MLLKLCKLILGCAINIYLFGHSRGTLVFPNLLGLFCPFPETLGLIAFPKILADPFLCPKRHFYLSENKRQKFEAITGLPNRYSTETIRLVPQKIKGKSSVLADCRSPKKVEFFVVCFPLFVILK